MINSVGSSPVTVAFGLDYKIPDTYVLQVPDPNVLVLKAEPQPERPPEPQPEPELEPSAARPHLDRGLE